MDLMKLTAVQLSEKIRAGEIRVAEALQAALDAIEEKDQTINAFITVDREGALKAAEEIQKKIDAGELTGPLAGVPVAVKDNICTKGLKTTCASKILYNFVPTYNAEVIENLRRAGMVVVGKTNMDEFAMGSTTETSFFGVTRNPRNPEHVPEDLPAAPARRWGPGKFSAPWAATPAAPSVSPALSAGYRAEAYLRGCLPVRSYRLRILSGSDRAGSPGCKGLRGAAFCHCFP